MNGEMENDAILPAQFYSRSQAPEMRAIQEFYCTLIESAVRDWRMDGYGLSVPRAMTRRNRALAREAEKWLFGDSSSATVSFEFACAVIGQNPDALRRMLREQAASLGHLRRSPTGFRTARIGRQEDAA